MPHRLPFARAAALAALLAMTSTAWASRVEITGVKASSEYPPDDSGSYEAKRIADGKASTAWVEGESGNGLGASITLDFSRESEVARVTFWAGMWYSPQYWDYSSRPTEVELSFDDGTTELVQIPNEMKPHVHKLAKPVTSRSMKITLRNVKSGSTFSDTGISEVLIEDTRPGQLAPVRSVVASSTAASDADGSYDPANLHDGLSDTMWCAGDKTGDGSGSHVEYTFAQKTKLTELHVNNGIGTSLKYFMKGNRAQNITLTFDDGSTQQVKVANTMLHKAYPIQPVTTGSVKLTFDDVVKGKEFDDLCISEAYFEGS